MDSLHHDDGRSYPRNAVPASIRGIAKLNSQSSSRPPRPPTLASAPSHAGHEQAGTPILRPAKRGGIAVGVGVGAGAGACASAGTAGTAGAGSVGAAGSAGAETAGAGAPSGSSR